MSIFEILIGIGVLVAGALTGWILNSMFGNKSYRSAKVDADRILRDAKDEADSQKNEKLIELEEEIFQQKQKLEDEFRAKNQSLKGMENQLANKENNIDIKNLKS